MAWRTGWLSACVLSWPSRFCHDGALTSLMPDAPFREFHSVGLICSMKLTWPDFSSWTAVVSCGTTRKTTRL